MHKKWCPHLSKRERRKIKGYKLTVGYGKLSNNVNLFFGSLDEPVIISKQIIKNHNQLVS